MHKQKSIIFIYGPTAVGKSDYAVALANVAPIEIINCDVGQFYTPLSIGTAKPDWKQEEVPHHLFDILDEPQDYTVVEYKKVLMTTCAEIWNRGATPVVVGGSGFYIKSLFFTPSEEVGTTVEKQESYKDEPTEVLWQKLIEIDPKRVQTLHPHDRYRIERSLILASLNKSASSFQPEYQDLGVPFLLLCLSRERDELYQRINERTQKMITSGWIDEVVDLEKSLWSPFLKRKKLIGYDAILNVLEHPESYETLAETIAQKTRQYAKKQMTFWRMLERSLTMNTSAPSMVKELPISNAPESLDTFKKVVRDFLKNVEGRPE